ncbi:MAG TPA: biotin carboxylase N-terminal domain-containing protein [Albitalea sp.]|nr:biotin carboxylase N-terminal domain-containing protein [Albitalea sp.]
MRKLLIANRGEIALRVMRSAHVMGIATVAVYSDADAAALHVRAATQAFALGGAVAAESYLAIAKLIAAARATGADAVHPGYGFLSENAEFAQAVIDAGLTWVGPPPVAIHTLGSKSGVKRLAAELAIPCLPGYDGADQSDTRFADEAARIGFPLMVKAAAGGGGRGMRWVEQPRELPAALASARSEALASFGSAELLIERALRAPRHVEVQVFADAHGHCIHLGERDCSVQRRHQKIIEEAPSPAVDAALRERMAACAIRLAQAAGYVGAGTVEFLLDGGQFYLMEMNTRLQVEHPVTEALTGIDLVEWQLRIARGEPLPLAQADIVWHGHAIEVRLCAEDENFMPHAGTVRRFVAPPVLRFDHALCDGAVVPPYYDSMLGKLVAHGTTREEAIARLIAGLQQTTLLGLPNNRALLIECLGSATFREGRAAIPFLADEGDALRAALVEREHALGCLLHAALWAATASPVEPLRLCAPFARPLRLRRHDRVSESRITEQAPDTLRIELDGKVHAVQVHASADAWQLQLDGVVHTLRAVRLPSGDWHLQINATDLVVTDLSHAPSRDGRASLARELKAPFSGRIVALHAAPGAEVAAGDTLLVIESMKLEHAIIAPRSARLSGVAVALHQQVSAQQLLVQFEAATP